MAHSRGTTSWNTFLLLVGRQCRVLAGVGLLAMGVNTSVAPPAFSFEAGQSLDTGIPAPSRDQARVQGEARLTPFAELMGSLATVRSRLDELSRLTEEVAAKGNELGALRARDRNILAEVQALHADRHELREARDAALVRIEDLGEQATSITQALGRQLAAERQQNSELSDRKEDLAAQLLSFRSAHTSAEGEIASLRGQLENSEQRLAAAAEVRTKIEAELVALERRSLEDEQKIRELKTQISSLQDQLKDKDAALEGLASLRTERGELQHRVAAMELELKGEQNEKGRLSAELAVFRSAAETATDLARQHLLTVEGKIRELHEAASAVNQGAEPKVLRGPKLPEASGSGSHDDLGAALAPSPSSTESALDTKPSAMAAPNTQTSTAPDDVARQGIDEALQLKMVDALQEQRKRLEGLMKSLDNSGK